MMRKTEAQSLRNVIEQTEGTLKLILRVTRLFITFFILGVVCLLAGIWLDIRFVWSGLVFMIVGLFFAVAYGTLDEHIRKHYISIVNDLSSRLETIKNETVRYGDSELSS